MFNNNSNNRNVFGENTSQQSDGEKFKFRLQLSAGAILVLGIFKLIFGMSQGFQSDLFTALFILLASTCANGFIAGYLVISLMFEVIITSVFFLLQMQNFILSISNPLSTNSLVILWGLNIVGFVIYSVAIFYCYRFFDDNSNSRQGGYTRLNDQQNQSSTYGTMSDRENNSPNNNFKAFGGKGTTLDG